MISASIAKRAVKALLPTRSPFPELMTAAEYRAVMRAPTFTTGDAQVAGQSLRYSDTHGLLHSIGEVLRDRVYQFNAKTNTPHIIDAGANIGLSVLFFKQLYPYATIVAYEPDADIFALLKHNVGALPGVTLHQAAAWVEDTVLTFYREGSLAGSVEMDFLGRADVTSVAAKRLKHELQKRPVDFLKIDIEGAENAVLFDIEDELAQVDHLFFEYHSTPGKPQLLGDLLNLVSRNGFRYVLNSAHGAELPFVDKTPHGFDLQLNAYCFRD